MITSFGAGEDDVGGGVGGTNQEGPEEDRTGQGRTHTQS